MKEKCNIDQVASLARINLPKGERENLTNDLSNILGYIEKLDTLDTKNIEPTSHVLNLENVYRDDVVKKNTAAEKVLEVLPETRKEKPFFKVPKVIEE